MVEYRASREPITEDKDKNGLWRTISLMASVFALLIGAIFATVFWKVQVKDPKMLRDMNARVVGGPLPGIVVDSNKVMAGAMKIPVDVPALDASSGTEAPAK